MANKPAILTDAEIGKKIQSGLQFCVGTIGERKRVLMGARYFDRKVSSRKSRHNKGFVIDFWNPVK